MVFGEKFSSQFHQQSSKAKLRSKFDKKMYAIRRMPFDKKGVESKNQSVEPYSQNFLRQIIKIFVI
jgi:hypothetical protein